MATAAATAPAPASLRDRLTATALVSWRGALLLLAVALLSYAIQAAAWPLERGRDSWDYWLYFLELLDTDPPFSALMPFRTPVTPIVVGAPMALGGAALTEVVIGLVYAASIVGWAWAVAPLGRRVAVAMALVMLVNVPYAGLFHEVSSDFVFAALFAGFAGIVVRACANPSRGRLVALGGGVAALTLCRPTGQVAVVACVLVPLLARRTWRARGVGVVVAVAAAAVPLGLWAAHNAVRYDDFAVARGGKAWVPFFRVASSVDPANGPASRRLAEAVEREVLPQPPYRSRGVDVERYFRGVGNLEVIRLIALHDAVFGWDADYQTLYDASIEAIRAEPGAYARAVADTTWAFVSQRYAPDVRVRPVEIPAQPAELEIDGRPFPAPITVSPLREAVRYGLVWCPTDELARCLVDDPAAALGSAARGARYEELTATLADWNAQLPVRASQSWLAAKGSTLSWWWPVSVLWIALAVAAFAIRWPRGLLPVGVLAAVAGLVVVVHALSQAPQNEFALPVAPVWIMAALVGLLGELRRPRLETTALREELPPSPSRLDVVQAALERAPAGAYLELGVRDGACLHRVRAATRVGVDPAFGFSAPLGARLGRALRRRHGLLLYEETSDAFFGSHAARVGPFAVVFVDGLHTADQSHRDVLHALDHLVDGGFVILHDCNPRTPAAAAPSLEEATRTPGYVGEWNGDVYRTIVRLRTRPDLRVEVLDADHGLGIVTRGAGGPALELSEEEVDALTYDDLARDREHLLGLRPAAELSALLGAAAR